MIQLALCLVFVQLCLLPFTMSFQWIYYQGRGMAASGRGSTSRGDPFLVLSSTSHDLLTTFPSSNQEENDSTADDTSELDTIHFANVEKFDEELERIVTSSSSSTDQQRITSLLYGKQQSEVPQYANEAVQKAVLAEDLLHWMLEKQHQSSITPTAKSYNAVLKAWRAAISNLKDTGSTNMDLSSLATQLLMTSREAGTRAINLLHEMESAGITPTIDSYNAVLHCVVKSRISANSFTTTADQVQQLFDSMTTQHFVSPNSETYHYVIDEWARYPQEVGPERAEKFLLDMTQRALLSPTEEKDARVVYYPLPDRRAYISVLTGWATNSADKRQGAQRAEDLLVYMNTLPPTLKPDAKCYSVAIDAWSKCGQIMPPIEAAKKADQLLQKWEQVQHETYQEDARYIPSYNSVIKAYSHVAGDKDSPYRAQELLDKLEETSAKGYGPNIVTYTAVIMAWARSPLDNIKAQYALKTLKRINEKFKQTGDENSFRPNLYTYNAVLNACATSKNIPAENQEKVTKIMFAVFKALEQQAAKTKQDYPSHITYGILLKGIMNLMPLSDSRDDVVRAIFEKCCRDGQVDTGVIKQLLVSASGELYQQILNSCFENDDDGSNGKRLSQNQLNDPDTVVQDILPKNWSRNVKINT